MWIVIIVLVALVAVGLIAQDFRRPEKDVLYPVDHEHGVDDPQFRLEMNAMLGPDVLKGNSIQLLNNGDEIFPAMLEAIRSARVSITFETYIYWSGSIGREFADALVERARAGLPVHVMLDWVGSVRMDDSLIDELRDAGVEVQLYHPLRWYRLNRLNNRTHRKLLVIDGRIGFTGGVGIADNWRGHAQDTEHWRDIHFRIEGPVVAQLQAALMDNWIKTTGLVLHSDTYYPELQSTGEQEMHLFVSSPAGGSASMHLMYLLSVAAAEHSMDLQASYFIPDSVMVKALLAARRRDVRIRLQMPGKHIDSRLVRIASKRRLGELLEAGVEVFEYQPTMVHNKLLIIDGLMVSLGSTNFDMRSFDLNDEASLNVYCRRFARAMTNMVEADLKHATPYTLEQWQHRSWLQRLGEQLIRPIESQL